MSRQLCQKTLAHCAASHDVSFRRLHSCPLVPFSVLIRDAMACIPLAYPPSFVEPKLEPVATPEPSRAQAWKLPNLGPYPTSFPWSNGVQKRRQKQKLPYRQKGSLAHVSPDQQILELRQSRKAIKNKLYSSIARLQVGAASIMPLDRRMLIHLKARV